MRRLTHPEYALGLASDIRLDRATPSQVPMVPEVPEGRDTSHFSIIDRAGNRVAATLSRNFSLSVLLRRSWTNCSTNRIGLPPPSRSAKNRPISA